MGNEWEIDDSTPRKDEEEYEWRAPGNDQEHVEETTAPGDLNIRPGDIELKPTLAPTQSGVQSGESDWTFTSQPDSNWYVYGSIIQD
jgi:hypothetical protein